jgi:hypothetical protein
MASGITGVNPKEDSQLLDGPGIKDTGIIVVMYTGSITENGTDSKVENGSSMAKESHSSQVFQEDQRSADLSISKRGTDSHHLFQPRGSQDAKLEMVRRRLSSCGPPTKHADSLEVD